MLVAGWRFSLSDAPGPAIVVWVCGCNLRCPFCHNWRIANSDPEVCWEVSVDRVFEEVVASRHAIDYVQVSGGEPLMQVDEVRMLFEKVRELGLRTSLNSNLTMPVALGKLIDVVDYVVTDLKIPDKMFGVESWDKAFSKYLESLRIVVSKGVELELRIPAVRLPLVYYLSVVEAVAPVLRGYGKLRVSVHRVLGEPVVTPRSASWCRQYCLSDEEFAEIGDKLSDAVREYLGVRAKIVGYSV